MSLPLLHSPADVIRWVLIGKLFGSDPVNETDWPIFVSKEPPAPDNCITIYNTSNQSDGRSMVDGEAWFHYGIQVRIRAISDQIGHPKGTSLLVGMNENVLLYSVTIDNTPYLLYNLTRTQLLPLGADTSSSKRYLYTINALATLKRLE